MSEPTHHDIDRIEATLAQLADDMRIVKKHLIGESEPERSLVFKVAEHSRELAQIKATRDKANGLTWTALGAGVSALALWVVNKFIGSGGGQP